MNKLNVALAWAVSAAAFCISGCDAVQMDRAIARAGGQSSVWDGGKQLGHNLLFSEGWKFLKGDEARAKEPGFDDKTWRVLDLPHDWSVEEAWDPKLASCTAFLPCGIGWYRKTLTVPANLAGKSISIRFDGVMNHSTVYCNGQKVGERPYGYSSFTCDLTPVLKTGAENVIAVRVDHTQYADSRWYAGSGIYRDVFLNVTDPVHVETNGTFVTTPTVTSDHADVDVKTTVRNDGDKVADVNVVTQIRDERGALLMEHGQSGHVPSGGQVMFDSPLPLPLSNPKLWSPANPQMYHAITLVKRGGMVVDRYETPFGIRTFNFDPAKGFSLNGESMKIKGVCLHHEAGVLGAAVPIQVWARRLKILQEAGVNAIRCSHNPPSPAFLDLCDRMGFLVMDEAFDEWVGGKHKWITGHNVGQPGTDGYHSDFEQWADTDIKDMVVRDRNHPSIIMWSIGNEIDYTNDPFPPNSTVLPPVAQRLIKDVKEVDTTRPVTAACAFPATNLYKQFLDIEGYNYMERLYAGDHQAHPERVIYGSENSHNLQAWQAVVNNDYIAGQFLWTGADYLGEAGVWPAHASGAGLLNLASMPKPQYYFRKSLWTEAPMVYLSTQGFGGGRGRGGRGGAAGQAGQMISCYTNCDSVELFKDGKSLGSKPHAPGEVLAWPVDFSSGALKAVGKKGSGVTTFELRKAGTAAKLAVLADVKMLKSDGRDVAQIEVDVTDGTGTLVADGAHPLTCTVSGAGRLLGMENGDIRSTEPYKNSTRSTYQGRMMVYVQSLKQAGELKVTLAAPNLAGAALTLPVK